MNRFKAPYGLQKPPLKYVLQWKLGSLFRAKRAKNPDDDFELTARALEAKDLDREENFIVWLGHATFLIQLEGVRILTDPVFGSITMVKRLAKDRGRATTTTVVIHPFKLFPLPLFRQPPSKPFLL